MLSYSRINIAVLSVDHKITLQPMLARSEAMLNKLKLCAHVTKLQPMLPNGGEENDVSIPVNI